MADAKIKTKKKSLYVETLAGKANVELDIVKKIDNKILIKTWKGFSELTFSEKENCWIVTKETESIPKEWEDFII